jgi:hypothetical protein
MVKLPGETNARSAVGRTVAYGEDARMQRARVLMTTYRTRALEVSLTELNMLSNRETNTR